MQPEKQPGDRGEDPGHERLGVAREHGDSGGGDGRVSGRSGGRQPNQPRVPRFLLCRAVARGTVPARHSPGSGTCEHAPVRAARSGSIDREARTMAAPGTSGAAGRAPAADRPEHIRNVVLVGHTGAGKTTLVEALLVATGTIPRAGRVEDGTTVSDFDEAELRQQRSVSLALAPLEHEGIKVNLLDAPGYA